MTTQSQERIPFGSVLLLIFGLSLAALNGALMKFVSGALPEVFIVWSRYTGYFIIMIPVAVFWTKGESLFPVRPVLQFWRAVTLVVGTLAFVIGAKTTDFADAISILYIYPFLLTLMAPFFLGEKVPKAAWLGVVGGALGVLLVAKPTFRGLDIGALYILLCGLAVSIHNVLNRKIGPLANPLITSMWGALLCVAILSVLVPFSWQTPTLDQLWILIAISALAAISQSLTLIAFARAPGSLLAPFTYTEVISAVFIGLALFRTLPGYLSWVGIGLIVASGLVVSFAPKLGPMVSRRRHPPF